jgi:hypothetical protein
MYGSRHFRDSQLALVQFLELRYACVRVKRFGQLMIGAGFALGVHFTLARQLSFAVNGTLTNTKGYV